VIGAWVRRRAQPRAAGRRKREGSLLSKGLATKLFGLQEDSAFSDGGLRIAFSIYLIPSPRQVRKLEKTDIGIGKHAQQRRREGMAAAGTKQRFIARAVWTEQHRRLGAKRYHRCESLLLKL